MAFKYNCNIKYDRDTGNALKSTDSFLVAYNIIDKRRNILDLGKFRDALKWLNQKANEKAYFPQSLYVEVDRGTKAVPNYTMFGKLSGVNKSKVKEDIEKIEFNLSEDDKLSEQIRLEQENKDLRYSTTQSTNKDLQEGLQWLKQIMPDVEPILVDGLINNIANGSYDTLNDLITLSKDFANKNVVKEEAFHRVFNLLPKSEQEKLLNEGSKKYNIPRGKSTATIKYSQADQNKVDFGLKAVEILQSDKAKQVFEKGEKNKWDLNKILTELAIPKEQKQLILDLNRVDNHNIENKLKMFFNQFGFQFKEGDSSTDLLKKIIYVDKSNDDVFINNSVKALSQLLLANTNIDFNKLEDLIEETSEFKDLLKKSSEYIKNTHKYLKEGNRIPMEEWVSYIKEYNEIKNTVLEKYIKESLLDKNNSTRLHKLINDFLNWFKDLFTNAKNLKEVTDSLIQQVLFNQKEVIINSKDLQNKEKVTLAKALEETTFGKDIIKTFGEFGLTLTGSLSAAEQGSVFRKTGKLLHDIDWVVPKDFNKDFIKKLKDTFTGATLVREFDSPTYYTQTYIVPPKRHTISNLTFFKPEIYGEHKYIASYDVLDKSGKIVSNYRRYYDVKESGKVVENKEVYNEGLQNVDKNIEAISVDFFQNKDELKFKPYTVYVEGVKLQLSNWMSSFTEKLKYGRAKDLLDYANFIPNDTNPVIDLREQIITDLLANYSYTVEINTAKENHTDKGNDSTEHINLSVPGGTNYKINVFKTPLIVPSIIIHFFHKNQIGWFRSDDKVKKQYRTLDNRNAIIKAYKEKTTINLPTLLIEDLLEFDRTKDDYGYTDKEEIGRKNIDKLKESIRKEGLKEPLELVINSQGAVVLGEGNHRFQALKELGYKEIPIIVKGRGSKDEYFTEVRKGKSLKLGLNLNKDFNVDNSKTRRILEVQSDLFQKGRDKENLINPKGDIDELLQQNQFLQLLNKDSNWVTFFVKSIIQDSAKKGYEKVLFPSGNTASKVEGHSTLEQFKKQKEDRIKFLDGEINDPENIERRIEEAKREKEQLKQELERVEIEGFGALKPIYNFYENTVTNILKKQGYAPTVVTDEYGNTWNEITITSKMSETIRLNTPNGKIEYTGDLAIEEKIAEEAYNSKDEKIPTTLIGKFIQSIKNMLRNLYKEKDNISKLIRDLNQGKFSKIPKSIQDLYEKAANIDQKTIEERIKKCE